jgi:hypothetical protein
MGTSWWGSDNLPEQLRTCCRIGAGPQHTKQQSQKASHAPTTVAVTGTRTGATRGTGTLTRARTATRFAHLCLSCVLCSVAALCWTAIGKKTIFSTESRGEENLKSILFVSMSGKAVRRRCPGVVLSLMVIEVAEVAQDVYQSLQQSVGGWSVPFRDRLEFSGV